MFHFTIRDVLWLTVVVALALGLGTGWWRDHTRQQQRYDMLRRASQSVAGRPDLMLGFNKDGDFEAYYHIQPQSASPKASPHAEQMPPTLNRP